MYHLEERSASTAIPYKKCAQIFVSSVKKTLSDIQFVTLRRATRYNVNMVLFFCIFLPRLINNELADSKFKLTISNYRTFISYLGQYFPRFSIKHDELEKYWSYYTPTVR